MFWILLVINKEFAYLLVVTEKSPPSCIIMSYGRNRYTYTYNRYIEILVIPWILIFIKKNDT